MRKVLVVEDEESIASFVAMYLKKGGFSVAVAKTGAEALAKAASELPALIVLDLALPDVDGIDVCRRIRQRSDVPILMLSARGSTGDRVAGIAQGADDYLPKPFSPAELVVRVQAILRRSATAAAQRRPGDRGVLRLGDVRVDLDRHEVTRDGDTVPLTSVEFRLLAALIEAGGRVLTREVLIDMLYSSGGADVFDRTIDVHIRRLRDKLGDDADSPRYVATVRGAGYRAARG
jgi:two-component system, OmpR family, phosphate regulon response regulator OmpR